MNASLRPHVAGILGVVGLSLVAGSVLIATQPQSVTQSPAAPAAALERVLQASDLQQARLIVPEDWAGAEQLFLSYLDRAFITVESKKRQADARVLAGRLAEVFFKIVEYPFAASLVTALDSADADRRVRLVDAARDYFSALERRRRAFTPSLVSSQFVEIADRFQTLSFPQGEWFALRSTLNLPDAGPALARADRLATERGDEFALVQRQPYTEATVAMAIRLDLSARVCASAESVAGPLANSTDRGILEQAAKYLEQCRATRRQVPVLETVNYWLFQNPAPRNALSVLPALWRVYQKLQRREAAEAVFAEAIELSRPFGAPALAATVRNFVAQSALARLGAGAADVRLALIGKVLPVYDDLARSLLASGDLRGSADALSEAAALQVEVGRVTEGAATVRSAIDRAEQARDWPTAARIANRAAGSGPFQLLPLSDRIDIATRAVDAAARAGDHLEQARALRQRSQIGTGARHDSLTDLQRAVAAAERHTADSGDPTEELTCLRVLANEHRIRGEYQAAIDVHVRRVEQASLLDSADRAFSTRLGAWTDIAQIYATSLGELSLARDAAERVRQLVGADQRNASGTAYAGLAAIYRALGEPIPALESYDKAVATWAERKDLPNLRLTRTNRARYLADLGDYEASLRDWEEVRKLIEPTLSSYGRDLRSQMGAWFADVARVHALAGDLDRALEVARKAALELTQQTSDRWVGQENVQTIVEILLAADHPEEALAFSTGYYGRLLEAAVLQPVLQKASLEAAARAYARMGQIDKARSLLLSAVEIDRQHPTAEAGGLGGSMLALGLLEIEAGNHAAGVERLEAAREAVGPYDVNRVWQIERGLGLAFLGRADTTQAGLHFQRALDALESVHERLRPEEFRLTYGFDRSDLYDDYAGLLAADAVRSKAPDAAARAFQAAERKRTQALWTLLSAGWSRLPATALPDQLRRLLDLDARLDATLSLLREQSTAPAERRDPKTIEHLKSQLSQIQAEHGRLVASLAQSQYRYASPAVTSESLPAPVRAAVGPARALVEYLVLEDRSYAFVVSPAGITIAPIAAGRAELRERVTRLLEPFRQVRTREVDLARLTYDADAAYALYRTVFAPVESALVRASDLLIVPDDALNLLPFEALVTRAPQRLRQGAVLHGEFAEEAFLIRRYAVGYLTSAAQLVAPAAEASPGDPLKRLFVMANPAAGRAAPVPAVDDPLTRQLRSVDASALFAPLPDSEVEVARIRQSFGADATIRTGGEATEAAYRSQAPGHRIVHFATHAVASDERPLYSTLLLAPDDATGGDGFLQAYEVLRTPLHAELVVLSACETAQGAEDLGQGLVGLATAFEQAGAKSVLATLWSIDESAADVMSAFYREIAGGVSTPAALRRAKLDLLQRRVRMGNVDVSLAQPFFWAPFRLIGVPAGR